ncbi:RNA polymerase sigma factor, partial [Parabacteroides distasonis]
MTKEQFIEQIAQAQEPLRRFLLVLCGGNGVLADDIAQEALLKA